MVESIWLLYGIIILIMFLLIKVVMKKQAIATKLALFLFILIILTVGYVYMSYDQEINSVNDLFDFGGVYFSWLGSSFHNFKSITGDVTQKDWSINNVTKNG